MVSTTGSSFDVLRCLTSTFAPQACQQLAVGGHMWRTRRPPPGLPSAHSNPANADDVRHLGLSQPSASTELSLSSRRWEGGFRRPTAPCLFEHFLEGIHISKPLSRQCYFDGTITSKAMTRPCQIRH